MNGWEAILALKAGGTIYCETDKRFIAIAPDGNTICTREKHTANWIQPTAIGIGFCLFDPGTNWELVEDQYPCGSIETACLVLVKALQHGYTGEIHDAAKLLAKEIEKLK